jgi:hypothetical protein
MHLSVVENGSLSCGFESGSECFLKNDDLNGDLFWIDHTVSTAKHVVSSNLDQGEIYNIM